MKRPASPLRAAVVRLSTRTIGVATTEVPGFSVRQVGRVVEHLVADGLAYRGKASTKVVRFFSRQADAEAFEDAAKMAVILALRQRPVAAEDTRVAPWAEDEPIHYPTDARGNPTWKFTPCGASPIGTKGTNTHHEDW